MDFNGIKNKIGETFEDTKKKVEGTLNLNPELGKPSAELIKKIENMGIVPVIVIKDANKAVPLAEALLKGGVSCIEVTFRTDAAYESIKRIHQAFPEMTMAAGTVITEDQAAKAKEAGCEFIVSPGYDQRIVDWSRRNNLPYIPAVSTAAELQVAVANGFKLLKFFPAEAAGGVNMIKNLIGPFGNVKFMTTGGISLSNLAEYAACPFVSAIGGSWMAKGDLIEAENWEKITELCKEAMLAVHGFKIGHIGMNANGLEDTQNIASQFTPFGYVAKQGNSSTFLNGDIEIMHQNGRGAKGHIAFLTYNVDRALAYLKQFGFEPIAETVKTDARGINFCYLNKEINGFAIHLKRA